MVGIEIKKYLVGKGIKQTFLADKIGMTVWGLNGRLAGNIELRITEYYRICKALGVPLETFLNEETIKDEKVTEDD